MILELLLSTALSHLFIFQVAAGAPIAAYTPQPITAYIEFDNLNGVSIGAPVVAIGRTVGSVKSISHEGEDAIAEELDAEKPTLAVATTDGYRLTLEIAPEFQHVLSDGAVGLVTAPLVRINEKTKSASLSVIELFPAKNLGTKQSDDPTQLKGYASFVDMWSNS